MITLLRVGRSDEGEITLFEFVSSVHRTHIIVDKHAVTPDDVRGRIRRINEDGWRLFPDFNQALESFFFAYGQEGVTIAGVDKMFGQDAYDQVERTVDFMNSIVGASDDISGPVGLLGFGDL